VSPTQIAFTASIAAGSPTEGDGWSLYCPNAASTLIGEVPPSIHITPCAITPVPAIASVQPAVWGAGQATAITVTGTNFIPNDNVNGCDPSSLGVFVGNQGVSISNQLVASPTQITAIVTPKPSTKAQTATLSVSSWNPNTGPVGTQTITAQIEPCPTPTVTSVSPNVWFAGQTYNNVVVTGTKFTTNTAATATCPATTIIAVTDDIVPAALGAVTVDSPTQITIASVTPPATETTDGVQVQLSGAKTSSLASSYDNADVLEIPSITWMSDPDGSNPIIAGPNPTLPNPSAVAGLQINLTTTPTDATLAELPIPVATSSTTWTVGGTNIGAMLYGGFDANGSPTSQSTSPTDLSENDLSTYWLYAGNNVAVTYVYCVATSTPAYDCATETDATFNVTGPTAAVAPVLTLPDATNEWEVPNPNATCPMQYLSFGVPTLTVPCPGLDAIPGIAFQPNVTDAGGGSFFWLQVINSGVQTVTAPGHTYTPNTEAGLDNADPYLLMPPSSNPSPTSDGPNVGLNNNYATVSDAFSANMYLMWQANPDTSSYIAVPVGYVNWSISSNAENTGGNPPWILTPCGGLAIPIPCPGATATTWMSSDLTGPAPGMPTWTQIVTNTN